MADRLLRKASGENIFYFFNLCIITFCVKHLNAHVLCVWLEHFFI